MNLHIIKTRLQMKHSKLFMILGLFSFSATAQTSLPQLGKSSIKEVIAAMTIEEKAKLVVGMGFRFPGAVTRKSDSGRANGRKDTTLVTAGFNLPPADPESDKFPEKVPGAAGRTHPIPRLGIPSITVSDGPAGVRISPIRNNDSSKTYYATAFPVATLLASSWDTALVKKVGIAFGSEVHEYGVDILLAPALNIQRNPLGGRNFEYYSEDPLVAGFMTAAMVNGIQSNGVGTSIKHYAANNQETNRNSVNTIVSERTMREIYLKGFEIAVKRSQPWTVMSSYNKINGTYTSERRDLLTDILRGEWGFKGFVMTDWFGGKDAVAQMNSGNDLLMPGNPNQVSAILSAIQSGSISKEQIDRNVEMILKIILQSPSFKKYRNSDKPDLKKDAEVTRMAAAEGMVLLKNEDGTLPLKEIRKVALFGNTSYDIIAGGTGSGDVNKAYTVSLVQGLSNAGYSVNGVVKDIYSKYIDEQKAKRPKPRFFFMLPPPIAELLIDDNTLQQEAGDADIAIITLGRNAGEGADRKIENDFNLSDTEHILIKNIAAAFHAKGKKVLVVLNIGGVIEVASWRQDVDAILLAWQPGLEAGNSIADVVSGKTNPSGKLPTTFPVAYTDVPSSKNFPGKDLPVPGNQPASGPFSSRPSEVTYEEGIYVGYRYYNTFNIKPAYEFGYGLSYTDFGYGNLKLGSSNLVTSTTASITITNNGKVAGKEVVELYISAPAQKLDKPTEELRGFAKTKLLQPGESQTVVFPINIVDIASYDTKTASWIAESGRYTVKVGSSSANFKSTATFDLAKDVVTEKDRNLLVPQVDITELKK
jgi:beta-glucosidase